MARVVRKIPATLTEFTSTPLNQNIKKKVAGYARVSTDTDEQFSSYDAQVKYYTNYIQSKKDWEFAGVYTDEGISGTSTAKREGFKTMISDALDGKINWLFSRILVV